MEVYTTQPGIQFYTGNFLDGSIQGKGRTIYERIPDFALKRNIFPIRQTTRNFLQQF